MLRKPHAILLAATCLVLLVLLALPEDSRSRVRVAFSGLFLPLFTVAGPSQNAAQRAVASITPRSVLLNRLQTLEQTNEALRLKVAELEAATRESDRLRQMLGFASRSPWRLRPARVIGRDPANWWQSLRIDIGSRDGVTTNLAVLTPEGLVGRVAEVGPWHSRVVLVGDPNCPVAAALADTSETGIIRGVSGGDIQGSLVELTYLPRNAGLKPGQRVVTSGQGGVFPPNITIGDLVDSRPAGTGVYAEARVRLAVNLAALAQVWVKLP